MEHFDERRELEYGAPELKKLQKKYSMIGLVIALTLHFIGAGAYWGSVALRGNEKYVTPNVAGIIEVFQLPPPPRQTLPVRGNPGGSKTRFGTPVPVPPWQVDSEIVFRGQDDPDPTPVPFEPGSGSGGGKTIDLDPNEPPPPFLAVEKMPEAVKQVPPKYPELAPRAGLEGVVWVKIWVDKEGKPRKAVVQKSDAEIFSQPASEAAMQWMFIPAMMKNGPVAVWVSIPFRFKLQGK